jgi:hypothetical protein
MVLTYANKNRRGVRQRGISTCKSSLYKDAYNTLAALKQACKAYDIDLSLFKLWPHTSTTMIGEEMYFGNYGK